MNSRQEFRAFFRPALMTRQDRSWWRRSNWAEKMLAFLVMIALIMSAFTAAYAVSPDNGYLHKAVDKVWAKFNYFQPTP